MFASVVWSAGAIVISGLNGLGHPGLSAIARIAAAVVMVVALLTLLPTRGIQGAAIASILGYSVMFLVALVLAFETAANHFVGMPATALGRFTEDSHTRRAARDSANWRRLQRLNRRRARRSGVAVRIGNR